MDFWSRLIAGTSLSPAAPSKAAFLDPTKRLTRFKRDYSQLLQVWRTVPSLSSAPEALELLHNHLSSLRQTLSSESLLPQPHPCLQFAARERLYISVGKIATTSYNESIVQCSLRVFSILIESEEGLVDSDGFSESLMTLLTRVTGAGSVRLSAETESEVVEVAFNISSKIRMSPYILPAWFTASSDDDDEFEKDHHEKFQGRTSKEDFPLFYLLIDYIHHEGRVGDFARTGLLYIIEAASLSPQLERWLVESDLATLMATGLGALYSQLSRKLVIDYELDSVPLILTLSDYDSRPKLGRGGHMHDVVGSSSPDFAAHMDTFLAHLIFWQDVLDHCKSADVSSTLLEHFQVIFLQQLLYPSLLESSDVDGGSSVAVLSYLRRILESVEHPDLIHLILHYLLALPSSEGNSMMASVMLNSSMSVDTLASKARKRKSINLATMVLTDSFSSPDLFNLVDLIRGSLQSKSTQTATVTLQLLSIILRRHHRYAVTTLLRTTRQKGEPKTIGQHDAEMAFLLNLYHSVATPSLPQVTDRPSSPLNPRSASSKENFDEVYSAHIADATNLLESHTCNYQLLAPIGVSFPAERLASIPGAPPQVSKHTIRLDDPILGSLTALLGSWYTNAIELNLALTESIIDMSICGLMSLDGWLLPSSTSYNTTASDPRDQTGETNGEDKEKKPYKSLKEQKKEEELALIQKLRDARIRPQITDANLPPLLYTLKQLIDHIQSYRGLIPRFDDLLAARRAAFNADEEEKERPPPPPRPLSPVKKDPSDRDERSPSSRRRGAGTGSSTLDSLASRIFPELTGGSRSASPLQRTRDEARSESRGGRGRGASGASDGSRDGSRSGQIIFDGVAEGDGAWVAMKRGEESQKRAFERVDAGILRRRVEGPVINLAVTDKATVTSPNEIESTNEEATNNKDADLEQVDGNTSSKTSGTVTPQIPSELPSEETTFSESLAATTTLQPPAVIVNSEDSRHSETEVSCFINAPAPPSDLSSKVDKIMGMPGTPIRSRDTSPAPSPAPRTRNTEDEAGTEDSTVLTLPIRSTAEGGSAYAGRGKTASVSHVLTNICILEQFVLELASLVQVRASGMHELRGAGVMPSTPPRTFES